MGGNSSKSKQPAIKKFYTFGKTLGRGSFGLVKEATRKSDKKKFAVKIINIDRLESEELSVVHDEKNIMTRIHHANVVQQIEFFESKKKLYLVMELLGGGELFDRIVHKGSFSESEAAEVISNVTLALKYLHAEGVVHRDLKPENLIYQDESPGAIIKITDFGLAKYRDPQRATARMNTACGTPGYVAPEVLEGMPYGPEVDLWSLGVILYILLCGFPPFYDENQAQLYKAIKSGHYQFDPTYWADVSTDAKDLISKLLVVNPTARYTPTQVLSHPWITSQATSKTQRKGHINRMRLLQAKRRLRAGVQTIIAINKFVKMFETVMAQEEQEGKTRT